jgi:hypothetical protein
MLYMARVPKGQQLLEQLQDLYGESFNPIIRMSELAIAAHNQAVSSGDMNDLSSAISNWDKVSQYVQPRLKAVEGQIQHNIRAAMIDMTGVLEMDLDEAEDVLLEAIPDD